MKLDRVSAIRRHLYAKGYASVADLAAAVGASEPTVRRDLVALEAEGVVLRQHGGAAIAHGAGGAEVAFEAREGINLAAKRAIGEAAYQMLRPETAVFLDAGTTVLQLARRIRMNPLRLRVFSNCLAVAQVLLAVPEVTVTLLGGTVRPQNASVVGPMAEEALGGLWFDQVFLGAGAISEAGEVTSAEEMEARLNGKMMTRSDRVTVLADAEKFGRRLTWRVGALGAGVRVVSDLGLAEAWAARVAEWGGELVLAGEV